MQEDYTQDALKYINLIIKEGKKTGKPSTHSAIEQHDSSMYSQVSLRWDSMIACSTKPPKEVYLSFMKEDQLADPVFAWALWWAKEKGIVVHFGPGGTTGWALFRSDPVSIDEIFVGQYSPFNPSSMMQYMDQILKYSALVHAKAMENQRDAEKSIEKTRNELESEREYARLQSRVTWS